MRKPIRFLTLTLVFSLLVFAQTFIRITPARSIDSAHQKLEDSSLLTQATEQGNSDCSMGVVLFTGFSSQSRAAEQTGIHKLARKLDALASPQLTTKVMSWFDDDDDESDIDADDIANGDIEAEVNRIANLPDSNGLILIGHSLGGDEALEQAALRERVDLLIQIDSVGYGDSVKPDSVVTGINYYQIKQSTVPSWGGRDIETNVQGSLNINVSEFDDNLDHGSIDDSDIVHQNIIQKIQAAAKSVCNSQPDRRDGERKRGRNFGDPHLFTFDGYRYSFQLVGEFILAKSEDETFEVQIRQSPVNSSLSVDSALSIKMPGNRIALYADELPDNNSQTPLRVNGNPTVVERELSLPGGGKIYHQGNDYVFEWPTGEELVAQINQSGDIPFINITVYVFETQANQIMGLLGNANGDNSDELRFRNGEVLASRDAYGSLEKLVSKASPVRLPLDPILNNYFERLTKDYGNDWRINQAESLFDYSLGQSTQTFTLSNFPRDYLALEQLSSTEISNARQICLDREVEPDLMEGCVFDVAFSGYSGFARAAARISQTADILRGFGIDVPDLEREIRNRIPGIPGNIRIPGLPF